MFFNLSSWIFWISFWIWDHLLVPNLDLETDLFSQLSIHSIWIRFRILFCFNIFFGVISYCLSILSSVVSMCVMSLYAILGYPIVLKKSNWFSNTLLNTIWSPSTIFNLIWCVFFKLFCTCLTILHLLNTLGSWRLTFRTLSLAIKVSNPPYKLSSSHRSLCLIWNRRTLWRLKPPTVISLVIAFTYSIITLTSKTSPFHY